LRHNTAIFLLLHFGDTVSKEWIAARYEERVHADDGAERIRMSEEETKRMALLAEALDRNPGVKPLAAIADEGRVPLVRSVVTHLRGSVLGTEITADQAAVIVSKQKDEGESKRLDGRFEVVEIDIENPEGYMGTLRDVKTQQEIKVSMNRMELPSDDIEALFAALKAKSSVDAMVNAWIIGGKISNATVVRADPVKP
jgi:hypothetical protein